jgi:uncharacterized membrane protein YphA (DoxX/SURF4 family)
MNYAGIFFIIGRILYGGFFVTSGLKHFTRLEMMAGYAKSKGVPYPKAAVGGSGIMVILGGLGVVLGIQAELSLLLIMLFLIPVTFQMHAFWADTDPNTKASNTVNFGKNVALFGAALIMLTIPTPWPYSIY